jgi:WD40 repeat protein
MRITAKSYVPQIITLLEISLAILLVPVGAGVALAQTAAPTPTPDNRGLGVEKSGGANNSQTGQQSREAKPELVLQTGYNNFFGATKLVFSPDGRLLATGTFRSNTIKLWDTATGRELRNLSSGKQSTAGMSPAIAFSRDSRLVAAAAGENSVKVWDVMTGREVQTITSGEGGMAAAIAGIYFIGFSSNNRLVTISDAIKVWDIATAQVVSTMGAGGLNTFAMMGGEGGATLSADGTQLARVSADPENKIQFWDLNSGRLTREVDLPDKDFVSVDLAFAPDGHLFLAGVVDKRLMLLDVTNRASERALGTMGTTTQGSTPVRFSRDARLLAISDGYTVKRWEVANGRELPALQAPNSGLFSTSAGVFAGFSDDGKKIATG